MSPYRITAVVDDRGIAKTLDTKLATGGEGSVFTITGRSDLLVKIFHPSSLADLSRRNSLEGKIRDMAKHEALRSHPQLAWPLLPLHAATIGWCGYAMQRKPGVSLRSLLGSPLQLASQQPAWHRQHLVRLCLDCLDVIAHLASHHALPIDFSPANILIDTEQVRTSFIDCDSFQYQGDHGLHRCSAITPEMAAPELIGKRHQSAVAPASVRFSLGMLLFYILTIGNSPYRHRYGDDPVHNLMHGTCALGKGAAFALPSGSFHRIWSHLIYDVKELFIRCFRDGHSSPEVRPSLNEWRNALLKYNRTLVIGHADPSLIPSHVKPAVHKH